MTFPILTVDENDQPLKVVASDEVWEKGLLHRIVRVMVEDNRGRILLQKRSPHVDLFPNAWDHSAAGHVDEGESYEEAAIREAAEEIGLKGIKLKEVAQWRSNDVFGGRILNRFNRLYKVLLDNPEFALQKSEVSDVKWFTLDEIKRLIKEHPDLVTEGLVKVIEAYY